jgi:hypothetical protein
MKHFKYVQNYKYGDSAKFRGYVFAQWEFTPVDLYGQEYQLSRVITNTVLSCIIRPTNL